MLPVYHDLELDLDLDLDLQVLVHPASCDNISTSAAKEDHVSMGGFAARNIHPLMDLVILTLIPTLIRRKSLDVVIHVEQVNIAPRSPVV